MDDLNKRPLNSCYNQIITILYIVGLTGFIKVTHTYLYNTRAANHNGVYLTIMPVFKENFVFENYYV